MGKEKYLKLEAKKEYTFGELLEWYLEHSKAKRKKTYLRDIEMAGFSEKILGHDPQEKLSQVI